jgi:hypothetical protein
MSEKCRYRKSALVPQLKPLREQLLRYFFNIVQLVVLLRTRHATRSTAVYVFQRFVIGIRAERRACRKMHDFIFSHFKLRTRDFSRHSPPPTNRGG